MKILITTDTFYPMINGVVISTDNLYKELKKLGHDVKVLTLSHAKKEKVEGDIYYLKAFKVKVYPDARVKHIISSELEKELIDWKPDVIHSQTEFSTLIAARYISKKTGAVHIHTYHTMYEEYVNYVFNGKLIRPKMVGKLVNLLFNRMDAVIVPTQKMKDCLIRFKVEKPLHIVPTGLDISKFRCRISEEERQYLLKKYEVDDKNLLIYVGRIAEEKNLEEIISFFKTASEINKDLRLMIVGGGPHLPVLNELVDKLELGEKVIFTGMIPPNEIYKYYQLGKIFVTASRSETQGLTYIEALASGVPVVCRRDPCVDGLIINGQNGYTYESEAEFIAFVNKLLYDDEHRKVAIAYAERKAMEYSAEIFGKRVYTIYNEVVKSGRKRRNSGQLERVNNIFNRIF